MKAPEEFLCEETNEQVDTYTVGHALYSVLTGLYSYYQYWNLSDHAIQNKVTEEQEKPFIDPRYRTRSYIESKLVEIIELCWEFDPFKRISIFEMVQRLRDVKKFVAGESAAQAVV